MLECLKISHGSLMLYFEVFLCVSFWIVFIAVSLISLNFSLYVFNLPLIPASVIFILEIMVFTWEFNLVLLNIFHIYLTF